MRERLEIGAYVLLLLVVSLACGGKGDKSSSGPSPVDDKASGTAAGAAPLVTMKATELVAAYKANEVRADAQYKGHRLRVTGLVGDIKKDLLDHIYVTIGGGGEFELQQVQAYFGDELTARASQLNKGQPVAVECDCDGLMLNVQMKNCVFVDLPTTPPPAAATQASQTPQAPQPSQPARRPQGGGRKGHH